MSKFHSSIIVMGSIFAVSLCVIFNISLAIGFFSSVLISIIIFSINGYSLKNLTEMIIRGISECSGLFIIILLIGIVIAVWMGSGILPSLIYFGFNYIGDINFLLACFLITATMAIIMATALGTISTIGMVLLVIGKGIEIPFPIILGAIISGAFIADKISPLGSMINLTLRTVKVQYKELAKHMSYTTVPAIIITALIYQVIGLNYKSEVDIVKINSFQSSISESFFISPLFLIIPLGIVVMAMIGIKVTTNMTVGILGAGIIGMVFQKLSLFDIFKNVIFGYQGNTGMIELDSILKGGGILQMMEVILIISGAVALSSIFEGTHFIQPAIEKISSGIKTKGSLIVRTGLLSILFTTISDASVGVLIPGKFMQNKFEQLNVPRVTLARTVADTGTSIAPLIPWNVNTVVITAITGVSVFEYGPFVFLSILSPIITIFAGYLGQKSVQKVGHEKNSLNLL